MKLNKIIFFQIILMLVFCGSASALLFNGSEYELTASSKTWADGETEAMAWGGHLVTINDADEQTWLGNQFADDKYFIGMNDIDNEGTWVWSSGEAVTYTYWAGSEPNNFEGNEDVAYMNVNPDGQWNDVPSSEKYFGIMERSAPVPEPATMLLFGTGIAGLAGSRLRRKKK